MNEFEQNIGVTGGFRPRSMATRVTDVERVREFFIPREHLPKPVQERLIEMVAESGAIRKGHFELGEDQK